MYIYLVYFLCSQLYRYSTLMKGQSTYVYAHQFGWQQCSCGRKSLYLRTPICTTRVSFNKIYAASYALISSVQPGYRLTRFTQLHTPLFAISITADHVKKVRRGKKVRTKVPERWRYVDLDYFKVTSMCLKAILHNCVR